MEDKVIEIKIPKLSTYWYLIAAGMAGCAVMQALEPGQFLGTIGWLVSLFFWWKIGKQAGENYALAKALTVMSTEMTAYVNALIKELKEDLKPTEEKTMH